MMKTKILASAVCALGLLASGSAAAFSVGGVDFGPNLFHIDTTTLAETAITGNGQKITGYGVLNTVNGNNAYAGTDKLFFIFKDYESKDFTDNPFPTNDTVNFSGGVIQVYKRSNFNLMSQSSATNLDWIDDGELWVTLKGHAQQGTINTLAALGTITGTTLSFTGTGLLDVDLTPGTGIAAVQAALNANTIADGFLPGFTYADIALTTSANNFVPNPNDDTTGCSNGTFVAGQWCLAGSADMRGALVPEPSVLALLGIGLLGMASARRKGKAAA